MSVTVTRTAAVIALAVFALAACSVRLDMSGVEKSRRRVKKGALGRGDGEIILESASGEVTVGGL